MKPASRALTIAAPIEPAAIPALRLLLQRIQDDLDGSDGNNQLFHPATLPDTHFTRFVVIEDPDYDGDPHGPLAPLLVWESNHDGRMAPYLRSIAASHAEAFDAIFGACQAYPGARDPDAFVRWMKRHSLRSQAFYCGYRGYSKREVDLSRRVHDAISAYLDEHRASLVGLAPADIEARLRAHLADQGLDVAPMHSAFLDLVDRGIAYLKLLKLARFAWWYPAWRRGLATAQAHEPIDDFDRPPHGKPEAIVQEDFVRQNQLTHLVDLKPGTFRRRNLAIVMEGIEGLARGRYVHGDLGGITSIHFARWVLLADPRDLPAAARRDRLLFFSNYDFSWDSYLGEFIDRAASGLTAVWSNTRGFPRTDGLTGEGARDEERFKAWTRKHQLRTDLWWSGVPDSTVENVRNDVWIRRMLARPLTDEELSEWLRRL